VVAPVVGSVEILFEVILKTEAVGNSRQGEIIDRATLKLDK
jgi:hypothetical protein